MMYLYMRKKIFVGREAPDEKQGIDRLCYLLQLGLNRVHNLK
jgi:hypothetical protein